MKVTLILVGKTTDKHFDAGINDYAGRIKHYLPFEITIIPELKNTKSLSEEQQKEKEGEQILKLLTSSDTVVLLDEPLDGLDPAVRRSVLRHVMDEVASREMSVLVSSHNLRELADVCDHVGIMDAGRMVLERSLEDLQGGFVKAQVSFADGANTVPTGLDVLHEEVQGRLRTMVVRGDAVSVEQALEQQGATFVNVLPLSLEEIFIYELGGAHHEGR